MHRVRSLGFSLLALPLLALPSCENKELTAEHAKNESLVRQLNAELEQTRTVLQKVKTKNPEEELTALKKEIRKRTTELEEAEDSLKHAKRELAALEMKSSRFQKRYKIQK